MEKKKICSRCQENKLSDEFGLNRYATDGQQSWCKDCDKAHKQHVRFNRPAHAQHLYDRQLRRNERAREFAIKKDLTKECRSCKQVLPADSEHFYRANGKLGFATNCKPCDNKKRQERRKKEASQ